MAKYRLIKQTDGNYSLQAILEYGGAQAKILAVKDVERSHLRTAATELAGKIDVTRKALRLARADAGLPGETE